MRSPHGNGWCVGQGVGWSVNCAGAGSRQCWMVSCCSTAGSFCESLLVSLLAPLAQGLARAFDNELVPRLLCFCVPCSVLEGHTGWINDVAVTNNGRRAVTASGDGTARLWETRRCEAGGQPWGLQQGGSLAAVRSNMNSDR